MSASSDESELLPFDLEIERTFLRRKRVFKDINSAEAAVIAESEEMGDVPKVLLRDLWIPRDQGISSGIIQPVIQANNFELKPALITMVQHSQFGGLAVEDPHEHIRTFLNIAILSSRMVYLLMQ